MDFYDFEQCHSLLAIVRAMNSQLLHHDVMEMIAEKNISLMVTALMDGDGLLPVCGGLVIT